MVDVAPLEAPNSLDCGDCFAGGLSDDSRIVALLLVPDSSDPSAPLVRADRDRFGLDDGGDRFEANGVAMAMAS